MQDDHLAEVLLASGRLDAGTDAKAPIVNTSMLGQTIAAKVSCHLFRFSSEPGD